MQFLWLSTILLGAVAVLLKLVARFSSRIRYRIVLGSLLALAFLPGLLWIEHHPVVPPIGLADWSAENPATSISKEPIFEGLPKLKGIEPGTHADSIFYWIGACWTAGALLITARFLISGLLVAIRCRTLPDLTDPGIRKRAAAISRKLNISSRYRFKQIPADRSPAVAGLLRPFVLIPKNLPAHCNQGEMEALLAHEMVHIKRKDYGTAMLQRILVGLLWVQPLAIWLSRHIDREREYRCDDAVTEISRNPLHYAQSLLKLKKRVRLPSYRQLFFAENALLSRIRRIAKGDGSGEPIRYRNLRLLGGSFMLAVILFGVTWSAYHLHF